MVFGLIIIVVGILFGGSYLLTKDTRRSGFIAFLILVWALVFGNAFNIFFSPLLSYLHVESSIVNYWLFLFSGRWDFYSWEVVSCGKK